MPLRIVSIISLLFIMQAGLMSAEAANPTATKLVYFDQARMAQSKGAIEANDPAFLEPYHQLLVDSEALLEIAPDPVVNKSPGRCNVS